MHRRINITLPDATIRLIGAGKLATMIRGNVEGYLIDKPRHGNDCLSEIAHMTVKNYNNNEYSGAIRLHGEHMSCLHNCNLQGYNGIDAAMSSYHI